MNRIPIDNAMTSKRLTPDQFKDALNKGLGRAALHLQEYGPEGMIEHLLHVCLHDVSYDPQLDCDRSPWLMKMIDLTGEGDFILKKILLELETVKNINDADQLLNLAKEFALRGNNSARKGIYIFFAKQQFNASCVGGRQIIELDLIDGLLHVAEVIGSRLRNDPDYWEDSYLVSYVVDDLACSDARNVLNAYAKKSANAEAYLNAVREDENKADSYKPNIFTFKSILEMH